MLFLAQCHPISSSQCNLICTIRQRQYGSCRVFHRDILSQPYTMHKCSIHRMILYDIRICLLTIANTAMYITNMLIVNNQRRILRAFSDNYFSVLWQLEALSHSNALRTFYPSAFRFYGHNRFRFRLRLWRNKHWGNRRQWYRVYRRENWSDWLG